MSSLYRFSRTIGILSDPSASAAKKIRVKGQREDVQNEEMRQGKMRGIGEACSGKEPNMKSKLQVAAIGEALSYKMEIHLFGEVEMGKKPSGRG
jgi:hypothetical protein